MQIVCRIQTLSMLLGMLSSYMRVTVLAESLLMKQALVIGLCYPGVLLAVCADSLMPA